MSDRNIIYKEIEQFSQKSTISGTEKIVVSDTEFVTPSQIAGLVDVSGKQDTLVSGVNIKTINGLSLLGEGDIDIQTAIWGNITGVLERQTDLKDALDAKQDEISNLATIESGAAAGATAVQPGDLATVATSGQYSDLTDTPTSISGYGITDAKIEGGVITLGSNTITPLTSSSNLSDLGNVSTTSPSDGQALIWDNANSTWKPGAAGSPDAVKYTSQSLTSEQQAQARTNIAAAAISDVPIISTNIASDSSSDTMAASPKAVYTYVGNPVVGISSPTPSDGTVIFTHKNGDTDTLDLNHDHPAYPKYVLCESEAAYEAITTKDSSTLYLIPESSS